MRTVLRPRAARAARAALGVPVLLLALAACGGDETTPASGEPQSSVSADAAAPSSSAPAIDDGAGTSDGAESSEGAPAGGTWDEQTIVPAMKAAMEEQRTAHVSMTTGVSGTQVRAEGDVVFRGARQDVAMTMDGAALGVEKAEVRIVDQVLYVAVPPMTPRGKFVEIRPGDRSSPFAGMVGQMRMMDPRDTFAGLDAGLRRVRFVGEEPVHGEDLEHYRLTVDFPAVAKAQGMPHLANGVPRRVTYDLWLDQKALMRRLELDMKHQGSLVLETSRWGQPVTIEAPPRRDIVKESGR